MQWKEVLRQTSTGNSVQVSELNVLSIIFDLVMIANTHNVTSINR